VGNLSFTDFDRLQSTKGSEQAVAYSQDVAHALPPEFQFLLEIPCKKLSKPSVPLRQMDPVLSQRNVASLLNASRVN